MTNNRVNLVKPSLTQLDKFKAVTSKMNDTYERKNHDYGDSFHKSLYFNMLSTKTFISSLVIRPIDSCGSSFGDLTKIT